MVRRAQQGEDAAFRALVDRRIGYLTARARRKIPDHVRRKVSESDVVQAALFTAYQKLPEFEDRGVGSFRRWAGEIVEFKVRNLLKRYYGAAKRSVAREVTGPHLGGPEGALSREPSPSAHAMADELQRRVEGAMDRLPDHYQQVIRMVRDEAVGLEEVGQRLGRSAKAVSKLYGRAITRLTKLVFEGEPRDVEGNPDR